MAQLFKGRKIADYFSQLKQNIQNDIDTSPDDELTGIDTDQIVDGLFKSYCQTTPKLNKGDISSRILSTEISGRELPSGTMFEPGKMYEIDTAHYTVPFSGNQIFFECSPIAPAGLNMQATVNNRRLLMQVTKYNKLSGNDQLLEKIKQSFKANIDEIERILKMLETHCVAFNDELKPFIKNYLEKKISAINIKNESEDKLNPFK